MSPTRHKGESLNDQHDTDLLETVVLGEQVLERVKSVSRRIVDACRRAARDDTDPDGPLLRSDQRSGDA